MIQKLSYASPRLRSEKVFLAALMGTTTPLGYGGFRRPPPGK